MNRSKVLQVAAVAVVLFALGSWSYSSGSSSSTFKSAAGDTATPTTAKTRTTKTHPGKPSTATNPITRGTIAGPTTTIVSNAAAYAAALYGYWTQRDRTSAAKVATPAVVSELFSAVWHKTAGWTAKGCVAATATTSCTWSRPRRNLVLEVRNGTGGLPVLVVSMRFLVVR